jgi:hypothetical protein
MKGGARLRRLPHKHRLGVWSHRPDGYVASAANRDMLRDMVACLPDPHSPTF